MKLRAGVEQLEVEMGRYKGILRADRICQACGEGVEDVQHVLDRCVRLREWRKSMWSKLAAIDVKMVRVALGWSTRDRVDWLLKGGTRQMRGCVMREVVCMLMQRDEEEGEDVSSERYARGNKS